MEVSHFPIYVIQSSKMFLTFAFFDSLPSALLCPTGLKKLVLSEGERLCEEQRL